MKNRHVLKTQVRTFFLPGINFDKRACPKVVNSSRRLTFLKKEQPRRKVWEDQTQKRKLQKFTNNDEYLYNNCLKRFEKKYEQHFTFKLIKFLVFRNNFVPELGTIDYLLYLNDSGDGSNNWVLDTQKGAVFKKKWNSRQQNI